MIPEVILQFSGGILRPLRVDDVHSEYAIGLNDPEVNRYLDGVKRERQTDQSIVEFIRCNQQASNAVLFGIWQSNAEFHCGTVRLHDIDSYHKTANIGICLFDRDSWGKAWLKSY